MASNRAEVFVSSSQPQTAKCLIAGPSNTSASQFIGNKSVSALRILRCHRAL